MVVTCFDPSPYRFWSFLGYMFSSYMSFPFLFGDASRTGLDLLSLAAEAAYDSWSCIHIAKKTRTTAERAQRNKWKETESQSCLDVLNCHIFSCAFPSRIENSQLSSCPGRSTSFSWAFSSWLEKMKCSCATQLNWSHGNHGIHGIHCQHGSPASGRDEPPHSWSGLENPILHCKSRKVLRDIHLYQHPINIQSIPMNSNEFQSTSNEFQWIPIINIQSTSNEFQWIPIQSSNSIDCLPTNIWTFVTLIVKICACTYCANKTDANVDFYRSMMVHGYT